MNAKHFRLFFFLLISLGVVSCQKNDMAIVRERLIEQFVDVTKSPEYEAYRITQNYKDLPVDTEEYIRKKMHTLDSTVNVHLSTIEADGSWADIDYTNQSRNNWIPIRQANRINEMTRAYAVPQSKYYHDEKLLAGILKAMDYWFEAEPRCTNWWMNEIGGPMSLGPVFLTLQDKMSPQQLANAIRFMDNAVIKITGQNRVWLCSNVMIKALLKHDKPLFEEAIREMKGVIVIENGEGIQYDWSFHQHGRQQQFGNYGLSYPGTLISRGQLFTGTKYAFNEDQLAILRNYLLDGMSWVIWRGEMDVNSINRQLFWPNAMGGKAKSYGNLLAGMSVLDRSHAAEYEKMFQIQLLDAPNTFTGLKHFFMSDQTVKRTPDWMASLKMQSDRTVGTETVNLENMLNEVMANGALYIYEDGGEYNSIFPIWDWTRVPGVTNNFASDKDFPTHNRRIKGKSEIVGGLVKDNYGVSIMRVEANGLTANKSWYFTDDYILCLGSDIHSQNGNNVTTSVEQAFLQTEKGSPEVEMYGRIAMQPAVVANGDVRLAWHNGIGYYFPERQNVTYRVAEQTGSWYRIHIDSKDTVVNGEVFSLYLNHGRDPKAASYEYVILPRTDTDGLSLFAGRENFKVIKNSDNVHAVSFPDGTVRCAFFTPGCQLVVDEQIEILDITEEIIMVFRREGNKVYISYVDPTSEKDSTIITVKGEWKGENALYVPEEDVTIVEFDTKISWGKLLEAECEIIG